MFKKYQRAREQSEKREVKKLLLVMYMGYVRYKTSYLLTQDKQVASLYAERVLNEMEDYICMSHMRPYESVIEFLKNVAYNIEDRHETYV